MYVPRTHLLVQTGRVLRSRLGASAPESVTHGRAIFDVHDSFMLVLSQALHLDQNDS